MMRLLTMMVMRMALRMLLCELMSVLPLYTTVVCCCIYVLVVRIGVVSVSAVDEGVGVRGDVVVTEIGVSMVAITILVLVIRVYPVMLSFRVLCMMVVFMSPYCVYVMLLISSLHVLFILMCAMLISLVLLVVSSTLFVVTVGVSDVLLMSVL